MRTRPHTHTQKQRTHAHAHALYHNANDSLPLASHLSRPGQASALEVLTPPDGAEGPQRMQGRDHRNQLKETIPKVSHPARSAMLEARRWEWYQILSKPNLVHKEGSTGEGMHPSTSRERPPSWEQERAQRRLLKYPVQPPRACVSFPQGMLHTCSADS